MRLPIVALLLAGCVSDVDGLSAGDAPPDLAAVVELLDMAPAGDTASTFDTAAPLDMAAAGDIAAPRDLALTGSALCQATGNAGGCGTGGYVDGGCVCSDGRACGYCDCALLKGACVASYCTTCARCRCAP